MQFYFFVGWGGVGGRSVSVQYAVGVVLVERLVAVRQGTRQGAWPCRLGLTFLSMEEDGASHPGGLLGRCNCPGGGLLVRGRAGGLAGAGKEGWPGTFPRRAPGHTSAIHRLTLAHAVIFD